MFDRLLQTLLVFRLIAEHVVFAKQGFPTGIIVGPCVQVRPVLARHWSFDVLLFEVIYVREQGVVVALADGVEFVVVALRAASGQSEEYRGDRVGAIDVLLETSFFAISS